MKSVFRPFTKPQKGLGLTPMAEPKDLRSQIASAIEEGIKEWFAEGCIEPLSTCVDDIAQDIDNMLVAK